MDFQPAAASSSSDIPATPVALANATKTCGHCKLVLPRTEFNWKNIAKKQLQSKCRACTQAYSKKHYDANKPTYVKNAARNKVPTKVRNQAHVDAALAGAHCRICDGTSELTHYQGAGATTQPVHQAVSTGLSLLAVQAAMDRSQVVCKTCLQHQFGEGLAPWQSLTHAQRQAVRAQRVLEGAPAPAKGFFKRYKRVSAA